MQSSPHEVLFTKNEQDKWLCSSPAINFKESIYENFVDGIVGFEDDFSTLNAENWPLNDSAYVEDGRLKFTQGGAQGFGIRYVQFSRANDTDFRNTTIYVEDVEVSPVGPYGLFIGFLASNPASGKNIYFYDYGNTMSLLNKGVFPFKLPFNRSLPYSVKFKIGSDGQCECYFKQCDEFQYLGTVPFETTSYNINTFCIGQYNDGLNNTGTVGSVRVEGFPDELSLELKKEHALSADLPALLKSFEKLTANFTQENANQVPYELFVQFHDDREPFWKDADGVQDSWTRIGFINEIGDWYFPELEEAPNRKIILKLIGSGGGIYGYYLLSKLVLSWFTDVEAPSLAVLDNITTFNGSSIAVEFKEVPADALGIALEARVNGFEYQKLSKRGKLENSNGSLLLVGDKDYEEKVGERNALGTILNGFSDGDLVSIKYYAVDGVGQISAPQIKDLTIVEIPIFEDFTSRDDINDMSSSPHVWQPTLEDFENVSDAVIIDESGNLHVNGIDGGFSDDFSGTALNPRYTSNNAIVNDGITFPNGLGNGEGKRYVNVDLTSVTGNIGRGVTNGRYELKVKIKKWADVNYNQIWFCTDDQIPVLRSSNQSRMILTIGIDAEHSFLMIASNSYRYIYFSSDELKVGDTITLIFKPVSLQPFDNSYTSLGLAYKINDGEEILTEQASNTRASCGFGTYYDAENDVFEVKEFNIYGYPELVDLKFKPENCLKAANGSKLAELTSMLVNLQNTSRAGNIALYLQRKSDFDDVFTDLQGNLGAWTKVADIISGIENDTIYDLIRDGELIRPRLLFTGGEYGGYPDVQDMIVNWQSDLEAPTAPTIAELSQDGEGGVILNLGEAISPKAYGAQIEIDINGRGYLPLSRKGILELGNGYMIFRGITGNSQSRAELNTLQYSLTSIPLKNTVQFKVRFVDRVGNVSAFTESEQLTITGVRYVTVFATEAEFEHIDDEFEVEWID